MTINDAIRARRSIRKYVPDATVSDEQVKSMLEAAMMAANGGNRRPWEFIVVKDRAKLDRIRDVHQYTQMLETASLAIVLCAPKELEENFGSGILPQDFGAATENILLQAVGLGLGTCWCGVYPREDHIKNIREALDIESLPFCVIAVGVPDEEPDARGFYEEAKVQYM